LAKALGITPDKAQDGLVALVEGGFGIAPRNPTNGMLVAYLEALTPPSGHEQVVTAIGKARVRWKAMLTQGIERSLSRKAFDATGRLVALASADTRPEGGDSTEIEAPFTSGAVGEAETPNLQHHQNMKGEARE
jgi:hypothetical protein